MDESNQYNLLKELSNLENRVSPNPRIRGTVYLEDRLYKVKFSNLTLNVYFDFKELEGNQLTEKH